MDPFKADKLTVLLTASAITIQFPWEITYTDEGQFSETLAKTLSQVSLGGKNVSHSQMTWIQNQMANESSDDSTDDLPCHDLV